MKPIYDMTNEELLEAYLSSGEGLRKMFELWLRDNQGVNIDELLRYQHPRQLAGLIAEWKGHVASFLCSAEAVEIKQTTAGVWTAFQANPPYGILYASMYDNSSRITRKIPIQAESFNMCQRILLEHMKGATNPFSNALADMRFVSVNVDGEAVKKAVERRKGDTLEVPRLVADDQGNGEV